MPSTSLLHLVMVPLVSAATGYVTNAVAVAMLFRPRRARRFLGVTFQGLIPKRRPQLAQSIGETVERHLISHEDIRKALSTPEVSQRIQEALGRRVDALVEKKLPALNPVIRMMLSERLIEKFKAAIMEEAVLSIGPIVEQAMDILEESLDFKQVIIQRIEGFDLDQFEAIVMRISRNELRAIEVWGGILGFLIGLATDLILLI